MEVNRDIAGVVVIGVLALAALGLTAATIDSTYSSNISTDGTSPSGPDAGGGFGESDSSGSSDSASQNRENRGSQSPLQIPKICIELLTTTPGILGLVGGIMLLIALAYRQFGFIGASFVGYLFGLPAVVGYGFLTQCPTSGSGTGTQSPLGQFLAQAPLGGSLTSTSVPPWLLIGVFSLAGVAAVVALVSATGSEDIETAIEEDEEEPDLEEFAATAGKVADHIESTDADVDNAVYRAWWEMTELLDMANPETSTPAEFADAAVEAGMNEEEVDRLTRLFEEARYGNMDPEPHEELALETFRAIEERYGVSDDSENPGDGNGGEEA